MPRLAIVLLACSAFLFTAGTDRAAVPRDEDQPAPAQPAVKNETIFDYQAKLGLSADQMKKIKDYADGLAKSLQDGRQKIQSLAVELKKLMDDEAPLDQIRGKLQAISAAQIDMQVTDIDTARKINATLTPAQLDDWHKIQIKQRTAAVQAQRKQGSAKAAGKPAHKAAPAPDDE